MATFLHLLFLHTQSSFGISQLKPVLVEPFSVTVVGLFWLIALPIGVIFAAAVATCDRMASLKSAALRLPALRGSAATYPLLLKRKEFALPKASSQASGRNQIIPAQA